MGEGGRSGSDPLSPKDEGAVDEMRRDAQALNEGEADRASSEHEAGSNVDQAVDATFGDANGPSPVTSPRHRIDRVAAEREAMPGGETDCVVCGRSAVLSCCAQCTGLDGQTPLVMCAIPDEPGGVSCFEKYHSE